MDIRTSVAFILISIIGLCSGFFLGGSESNANIRFHKGSQFGFEKNPNVYAHLVIPPWNRPFKPGYCLSWEWHTDKKYRDQRVAICKQFTEGKFCIVIKPFENECRRILFDIIFPAISTANAGNLRSAMIPLLEWIYYLQDSICLQNNLWNISNLVYRSITDMIPRAWLQILMISVTCTHTRFYIILTEAQLKLLHSN